MKYYLFLCLLVFALAVEEIKKEENVYVLTDDDFDDFLQKHDHVLVKFYVSLLLIIYFRRRKLNYINY